MPYLQDLQTLKATDGAAISDKWCGFKRQMVRVRATNSADFIPKATNGADLI